MDLGKIVGTTVTTFVVWTLCQSCWEGATAKHHTKAPEPPKVEAPKPQPAKVETPKAQEPPIEAKDMIALLPELEFAKVKSGLIDGKVTQCYDDLYDNDNYLSIHNPTSFEVYFTISVTDGNGIARIYAPKAPCERHTDCQLAMPELKSFSVGHLKTKVLDVTPYAQGRSGWRRITIDEIRLAQADQPSDAEKGNKKRKPPSEPPFVFSDEDIDPVAETLKDMETYRKDHP